VYKIPYSLPFTPPKFARAPRTLQFVLQPKNGYFTTVYFLMAILEQFNDRSVPQQHLRQRTGRPQEHFILNIMLTRI
jgi:hypothetical protein